LSDFRIQQLTMSANEICHSRREQQLIPEDVITRQDYDDWLRTLPRASSKVVAPKRVAQKIAVNKVTLDGHPGKARA
jgi:hypothetical protein